MKLLLCINDKGSKLLKVNQYYFGIEKETYYEIPIIKNNIEVSPSYRRGYIKGKKNKFIEKTTCNI